MREIQPTELIGKAIKEGADWKDAMYKVKSPTNSELGIIASYGLGWEHVSISVANRCPNWGEMCFVKDLFWTEDETVIQYHPPKKDHLNYHPNVLHLWAPTNEIIPTPPKFMVAPYDGWESDYKKYCKEKGYFYGEE